MTCMTGPLSTAVIWCTFLLFGVFATEATISAAAEGQSCGSSGGECLADESAGTQAANVADFQVDEETQPTALVQTRAKAKYEGTNGRKIVVGGIAEDEDEVSGDGDDADKELILDDFRTNLSKCMYDMMIDFDDNDTERARELDLIYEAEVLKKAHALGLIDEENIVWAAVLGAQTGAQRIAREQSRNALMETFAKHNMTSGIRDEFVAHLDNLAHLCNNSADADVLVEDEKQLLSTNGGPLKAGEAQAAMELAEYVISKCTADALDLEWFFAHAASIDNNNSCGTMVDKEIKINLGKEAVVHDAHVQTVLALHNEENRLGHHYAKHLQHVADGIITHEEFAHSGSDKLRNALLSDLSKPTRAKLRYLENKHFVKLHGATKRELCAQRDQLKFDKPDHFSLQSDTVYTKMYKCMCEDDEIFLVCQARHHEDVVEEQPRAFKRLQQAAQEGNEAFKRIFSEKASATSSVARANASRADPSGGGPCRPWPGISGCVEIGEVASGRTSWTSKCCLPARADANIWGSTLCGNPFGVFAMMANPSIQIKAYVEFKYGWPGAQFDPPVCAALASIAGGCPSCQFYFRLQIGVQTSMTDHWTDMMVNFNIFLSVDLCLGGVLGSIATALGWAACMNIGQIHYYPFIGKLTASLRLPLINLVVVSAWARLDVGGPVHDVTDAIQNIIANPDHNAFRAACPGCRGTSAAALVSYDADDTANTDDAANLGFWRRRRRDRRRRERRRDICLARPCNGGNAKEYWRAKIEDARGGLSLKITGEACALWWCWDLVWWEWKWATPRISLSGESGYVSNADQNSNDATFTSGSAFTSSSSSSAGGTHTLGGLPSGSNQAAPTGWVAKAGSGACRCRGSGSGLDSCGTLCCAASPYTDPDPHGTYPAANMDALCFEQATATAGSMTNGRVIALKARGEAGRYCADESNNVVCNRNAIGQWEQFTVEATGDKTALKGGKDGRYCADESNLWKCNRNAIGPWEQFTLEDSSGSVAFKGGKDNRYCADETNTIKCNRNGIGPWERFTIETVSER